MLLPADMPRAGEIAIDGGVIGFALAVSAAAGLLFGLLPAWRASGVNVNEALKAGSRSATAGRRSQRTQAALAISEACLSLVLVAGAGLLVRSFWNLRSIHRRIPGRSGAGRGYRLRSAWQGEPGSQVPRVAGAGESDPRASQRRR